MTAKKKKKKKGDTTMIKVPYAPNRDKPCPLDADPCIICGRGIRKDRIRHWVHIHGGGDYIITEDEATNLDDPADLLFHPVGPDCLRRHPEIKPYVHTVLVAEGKESC